MVKNSRFMLWRIQYSFTSSKNTLWEATDSVIFKSRNRNHIDPIVFTTGPTITLKKWTDAYHFARSSKSVLQVQSKRIGLTDHYKATDEAENITKMKSKDKKGKNGRHLINLKIFSLEYGKQFCQTMDQNGKKKFAIVQVFSKSTFANAWSVWQLDWNFPNHLQQLRIYLWVKKENKHDHEKQQKIY